MPQTNRPKRDSKDYITVTVPRKNYEDISKYLQEIGGEFHTANMGKFYDSAAMEKFIVLKNRNSLFSRFNSQTLISNKWKKIGGSSYQRGNDIVEYTGTFWLHNGERLTEDNYIDKIYDKKLAKVNPILPPRPKEK